MGFLNAGMLRHRITIQDFHSHRDNDGFTVGGGWMVFKELWAKVTPLSGKDMIASQAEQSEVTARMVIRYRADVTTSMRVIWKDRIYAIHSQALDDNQTGNNYCTFLLSGGVERFPD